MRVRGTVCALLVTDGFLGIKTNLFLAIIIATVFCSLIGVINGVIVARTKIDPFIVTLGSQTAVRGLYISSAITARSHPSRFL